MNELSTQVNEWLDTKEFATHAGCQRSSLNRWLRGNPEFVAKYVKYAKARGGNSGKKTFIHHAGILPYLNSKATTGKKTLDTVTASIRESKIKVAEQAIAKVKQVDLSDLLQQMEQLRMAVQEVKTLSLGVPSGDITDGQREFLNERVRYYASMTGVSHSWVWKRIHGFVGKSGIEAYRFNDYKPAYRYLKDMYTAAKLNWN